MTTNTLRNPSCAAIADEARKNLIEKMNATRATRREVEQQIYSDDVPWRGITKLMEEMNELGVELCKLAAFPTGIYPDHGGIPRNLLEAVIEELTDVQATLDYFREVNGIPLLWERYRYKKERFLAWGLKGSNTGDHNA